MFQTLSQQRDSVPNIITTERQCSKYYHNNETDTNIVLKHRDRVLQILSKQRERVFQILSIIFFNGLVFSKMSIFYKL